MQNFEPQTIDLNFQDTPGVVAVYAWDTGDGLALVDTGPGSTLDALEAGLGRLGAGFDDVRHVLLTHIHFDHAGAAGRLLELSPRARVYVQEHGARHLVNPERLYASAGQIYGDQMEALWGEMRPLDADRLTALAGGETLRLGRAEVRPFYTPGHAIHHLAYQAGDELYTGDVGGVRLDPRQPSRPPTPPPDIDLAAWRQSAATLRELDVRRLHLAHFGSYPQAPEHWDALLDNLEREAEWMREQLQQGREPGELYEPFTEWVLDEIDRSVPGLSAAYRFASPPAMNVMGLARYWTRRWKKEQAQGGQA
ncbi:MBL fold metallo-hydrolase [Deinococcus sp. Marseille-Q6407]|uniref:MBL fold metallo-hydrolase n=1 Tax=Deinococcus sp. Marseille-Q6407 TaxID=2969223 RepID=UPI0021BF118B|nr:MBL fold metallo-hydrolase [Deinococcus sp. Marseille-Q6407]